MKRRKISDTTRPRARQSLIFFGLAAALWAGRAEARTRALEAVVLGSDKVRIDGLLREWPAKLDSLGEVVQGSGGGDPSASGVIGYNDKNLFVAMKIKDGKLVRTPSFGDGEDYASLEIAFPTKSGFHPYSVRLYAGEIGRSAGMVKFANGGAVKGARLVEAPSDGGYTIEVSIPWTAFPEASRVRVGIRAALRYADADSPGSVRTIIGTSAASGSNLPPLLLEAEQGLYRSLVRKRGLSEMPARFAVGDIADDSTLEAVAVYGSALTIVGSAYRGGKEYFFHDLAVPNAAAVTRLEIADFTGDGKDDILLVKRAPPPTLPDDDKEKAKGQRHGIAKEKKRAPDDSYREVLQVLSVSSGENPYIAFQHETAVVTKDGEIRNDVSLKHNGSKVDIVIAQGKAEGFDPSHYDEPMPDNMESSLLPWSPVKSRTYEWDGKQFADAGSESWTPKMQAPSAVREVKPAAADGPPPAPPPRPPSADELLERVYALYRRDHHVGIEKPRFDFVADVAGDATPERVLLQGRDVVVFGKGFKEGLSYAYTTVGVDSSKDIVDVSARDVTGDGKAEVIVRGVLHAKASAQLGGKVVDRHAFYVYQVFESGLRRIFGAETGRSLGDDSITDAVRFVPRDKGFALELSSGKAVGWTDKTYPFPIDKTPYGGLEPLLVPWGDVRQKRYHFDGSSYVADE
ncbi:MAG TPA: hypothetical protein VHC69_29235 [Polyangiaceae bacterium]|nr:hypothetical protein [Polyangiaceae bacterium]